MLIILVFLGIFLVKQMYSQSSVGDSSYHPYYVNYWVTGSIIIGGTVIEKIGIHLVTSKSGISIAELQNLNRNDISPIDRWALNFDPTKRDYYERLSSQLAVIGVLLPVLTVLDHNIRRDWLDVLLIYLETQAITNNLYLLSPIGPTFQNRFRPVVYYDAVPNEERSRPFNRSSLYSGHTASIAETSFLTAKVYCDYHPELGWNKYLVYVAAAIPPLLMAYFRLKALRHFTTDVMTGFGVGALCGILIPELHRIQDKNFSVGFYSSSEATGLAVKWQPNFLK